MTGVNARADASQVVERELAAVRGRVLYLEVSPADRPARLTVRIVDDTGAIDCVFLGRRVIPGIEPGAVLCVEGRVAAGDGAPVIFNPRYELCAA